MILPAPTLMCSLRPAGNLPPLVQRLEVEFLESLRAGLARTEFLTDPIKGELRELLKGGVTTEAVANRLLVGLIQSRTEALKSPRRPGLNLTSCALHPADRLFEPFPPGREMTYKLRSRHPGRPIARDEFLASLPAPLRERDSVLEVTSLPDGFEPVSVEYTLHGELCHYGIPLFNMGHERTRIHRIPLPPLLESLLAFCFGPRAAALCYVKGLVTPAEMNELHVLGYHPVALVLEKVSYDAVIDAQPSHLAIHDLGHAVSWSHGVTIEERVVATALAGALLAILPPGESDRHGFLMTLLDLQWLDPFDIYLPFPNLIERCFERVPRHVAKRLPGEVEARLSLPGFQDIDLGLIATYQERIRYLAALA